MPKEEIPKGFIDIHGHIYEKESPSGINVGVEKTNYEPLDFEELRELIKDYVLKKLL